MSSLIEKIINIFITIMDYIFSRKKHEIPNREISHTEDTKTKGKKSIDYKEAIKLLVNCIMKAENAGTYKFGSDDDQKHQSSYYVDSQGFAQKNENCNDLYDIMVNLVDRIENDYEYVFSIKGGNIPLALAFSMKKYNVLSIMPKERNERVISGLYNDFIINYEGFGFLIDKAKQNEDKEIKGIAITCNLSNGRKFLHYIKEYNDKIEELQNNGTITRNIKKIENVFILYRAITGDILDSDFDGAKLKCYRYFDLSEKSKEILYLIKNKQNDIDDFPCYKCIKGKRHKDCTAKHCYKSLK
jgi:hypothetical protein